MGNQKNCQLLSLLTSNSTSVIIQVGQRRFLKVVSTMTIHNDMAATMP